MIFTGPFMSTTVPGVQLGLGAAEGAWVKQAPPNQKTECWIEPGKTMTCRLIGQAAGITGLQQALKNLATVTGESQYDPGEITGTLSTQTRMALGLAVSRMGTSLSSSLRYLAPIIVVGLSTGYIDSQVVSVALPLAASISLYTTKQSPVPLVTDPNAALLFSSGKAWYTTTTGMAGIGIGVLALILLLRR